MGWDFYCNPAFNKAHIVREKVAGRDMVWDGVPGKVIAHSLRGNHLWRVIEKPDGERFIALDLLRSGGRGSGWGYKGLCETMGPCEVDCPLSFLDMVPEPAHNYGWREQVRAYHEARRTRTKREWSGGQRIRLGDARFTLTRPRTTARGRKAGWYAIGDDGLQYRINAQYMAHAEVVP